MIKTARRPIIVSSNGVFYAKAWDALKRVAEKAQIPVVESGAMKGQFSMRARCRRTPRRARLPVLTWCSWSASTACRRSVNSPSAGCEVHPDRPGVEDIGRNLPIDSASSAVRRPRSRLLRMRCRR